MHTESSQMAQTAHQQPHLRRYSWPLPLAGEGRMLGLLPVQIISPRLRAGNLQPNAIRALSGPGRAPTSLEPADVSLEPEPSATLRASQALIRRHTMDDHIVAHIRPTILQDLRLVDLLRFLRLPMGILQDPSSLATYDFQSWFHAAAPPTSPTEEFYLLPSTRSAIVPRSLTLGAHIEQDGEPFNGDETRDSIDSVDDRSDTTLAVSGALESPSDDGSELEPTSPTCVGERRYENRSAVALTLIDRDIPAKFAVGDNCADRVPEGWKEIQHAEGSNYFTNDRLRIVTASRITNSDICNAVVFFYGHVERMHGSPLPPEVEVVLELDPDNSRHCWYYICDHRSKTVYWLEELSMYAAYWLGMKRTASESHLRLQLTMLYSNHMQLFPHRCIPKEIITWVICEAAYYYADTATNDSSTSPYKREELKVILEFEKLTRDIALSDGAVRRTHMIARFWHDFLVQKFLNFHYEDRPRLDRTKSIQEEKSDEPCRLVRWLTFIVCFNTPFGYRREIDAVWVDETCYGEHWERFVESLLTKWGQITALATILLTANVGFLAIPAVDDAGKRGAELHYISAISMLLSFASMFAGMLLIGLHHKSVNANGGSGEVYFQRNQRWGLHSLATLYSLPHVFFIWSALTFATAFFIFGLAGPARLNIVFGITFMIIFLAVLAVVAFFWDMPAELPHSFQTFWYHFGDFDPLPRRILAWLRQRTILPLFARGTQPATVGQ